MSKCMEFGGHLEAGVHGAVRENTPAAWARAKVRVSKFLQQLGDSKHQWLRTFANAVGDRGLGENLVESIIGYTLKVQVSLNVTLGHFKKVNKDSSTEKKTANPT